MRRFFLVSMLLSFFCAQPQAWAVEYFFVTLEFPPLEYTGEDGTPQGIAVDLVTRIMNNLGHTVLSLGTVHINGARRGGRCDFYGL